MSTYLPTIKQLQYLVALHERTDGRQVPGVDVERIREVRLQQRGRRQGAAVRPEVTAALTAVRLNLMAIEELRAHAEVVTTAGFTRALIAKSGTGVPALNVSAVRVIGTLITLAVGIISSFTHPAPARMPARA